MRTADGGWVFLDEFGELPVTQQAKLLRALQNREVLPVGATRATTFNALIVAATNRSLEDAAKRGEFRRDLYERFASGRIKLSPLRERIADVFEIARSRHLIDTMGSEVEAVERLLLHDWPGNVRELEDVITTSMSPNTRILRAHAVEKVLGPLSMSKGPITQAAIERTLEATGGNRSKAARILGIPRTTMLRKRKR